MEEPDRVVFRCPIHGSITMADSSVVVGVAKEHPELLAAKDGKVYFKRKSSSANAPAQGKAPPAPSQ